MTFDGHTWIGVAAYLGGGLAMGLLLTLLLATFASMLSWRSNQP